MAASWLDRDLVPLSGALRSYEVRRIQVRQRAVELLANHANESVLPRGTARREFDLSSGDGLVRGRADVVVETDDGVVLMDYKSGALADRQDAGGIREEYSTQLMMYAALYAERYKEWPTRLELVSLSGEHRAIPFRPADAAALLSRARMTVSQVNDRVQHATDAASAQEELARPTEVCNVCSYRPVCKPYRRFVEDRRAETSRDVWGTLVEQTKLGNGRYAVKVQRRSDVASIRGLSADAARHPGLSTSSTGTQLGVFNLARSGSAYQESPETVIYVLLAAKPLIRENA